MTAIRHRRGLRTTDTGWFHRSVHDVEAAYRRHGQALAVMAASRCWDDYADLFTLDAVLRRTGMPTCHGREAIRETVCQTAGALPGSLVERSEVVWHSLDTDRGMVVQQLRHSTCDPGDGSQHHALATTALVCGDDGLWSSCEVLHSPTAYTSMYRAWAHAAHRSGRREVAGQVLARLSRDSPVPIW